MRPAHYFRPEACPAARTTLRQSDEARPSPDISDTAGPGTDFAVVVQRASAEFLQVDRGLYDGAGIGI